MTNSTSTFIAYELRPAKQTERRMLLDYLEALKEAGVQVSSYRYIGMGGTKFYDFSMMYRYLAITDLISCEHNPQIAKRGDFNRPFARIEVRNEPVGDYLKSQLKQKPSVCWLDDDSALSTDIVSDILTVGKDAPLHSSIFVTVANGLPRDYIEKNESQRLDELMSEFGQYAGDLSIDDMEEASFEIAYYKIVTKAFVNAFSGRTDGRWVPYFCVQYKDSTRMLTVGGSFLPDDVHRKLKPVLKRRLPFLKMSQAGPYKIRSYNMTERERHLFEFAASARANCPEANLLRSLGFSKADLKGYRELVRFMPRYVEAFN